MSGRPSEEDRRLLSGPEIEAAGLADWRVLFGRLHARYRTPDFATALAIVTEVGAVADELDHHPDLDLSWGQVRVRVSSHDVGGVTARDVRLARATTDIAARHGATATPEALSVLEIALDTADRGEVLPFWAAVLGLEPSATDPVELTDPLGVLPTLWFQEAERDAEVPAQRFHLDLRVPPEVVAPRMRAALAAGGVLVSDADAPRFWVLADPQGNRVCLTTWQGRDAP
ncbi:4a-hydroxytetrahydrobiopterin dehydratase [Nocardioides pantholopis]|uniref:4a-hydroxytetrahydrobiopterin dehydratase n=1 Tax=Nocardioides pantholopis TaxID=2483798 RepID=UPI0019D0E734|nr:4a-hydroxytetrahydrobiopterin dehydratase [Nocardioides pantholopis]